MFWTNASGFIVAAALALASVAHSYVPRLNKYAYSVPVYLLCEYINLNYVRIHAIYRVITLTLFLFCRPPVPGHLLLPAQPRRSILSRPVTQRNSVGQTL